MFKRWSFIGTVITTIFTFQLKDDDKLMLLLEINKFVPLCHQLQTIIKTPLQNQVFLKVKGTVGCAGRHLRNVHTPFFIRLASSLFLQIKC